MLNQMFYHRKNDLENQVPLGNFWARGTKWGYMTKNHCHSMTIEIRIFPN